MILFFSLNFNIFHIYHVQEARSLYPMRDCSIQIGTCGGGDRAANVLSEGPKRAIWLQSQLVLFEKNLNFRGLDIWLNFNRGQSRSGQWGYGQEVDIGRGSQVGLTDLYDHLHQIAWLDQCLNLEICLVPVTKRLRVVKINIEDELTITSATGQFRQSYDLKM